MLNETSDNNKPKPKRKVKNKVDLHENEILKEDVSEKPHKAPEGRSKKRTPLKTTTDNEANVDENNAKVKNSTAKRSNKRTKSKTDSKIKQDPPTQMENSFSAKPTVSTKNRRSTSQTEIIVDEESDKFSGRKSRERPALKTTSNSEIVEEPVAKVETSSASNRTKQTKSKIDNKVTDQEPPTASKQNRKSTSRCEMVLEEVSDKSVGRRSRKRPALKTTWSSNSEIVEQPIASVQNYTGKKSIKRTKSNEIRE